MRKGNLSTPTTDVVQGSKSMKTATPGMADLGGLMGGDNAGVAIKQLEGVSVGSPKLNTPMKDTAGGTKKPSSPGSKIGKPKLSTPASSLRKGY